ncbi:MAG: NYN domain-containing protein [Nanoarchaeota archaeon]|nr:NYN domain-containing protein [Nanoarchaeota archaeon]
MKSLQHKDQKVAILIDVQNMYYSAKHMFQAKVNFKEILKTAVAGRRLIRAIAYTIEADIKGEDIFHKALENVGIEVKSKGLQTFIGGTKKGDWDIGLAMDAVRLANKVDTLVIVSGDGDFKDLLIYLKTHGVRTEIIAFSRTASKLIKVEADLFVDMELNKKKYLMPMKPSTRKPSLKKVVKPVAPQALPKMAGAKKGPVFVPK